MKHYTTEELDQYRHRDMNLISRLICRVHLCICSHLSNKMSLFHQYDYLLI